MRECENCESTNTIEEFDNGDTLFKCNNCGRVIENGNVTQYGTRLSAFDVWLYPKDLEGRPIILNLFRMETNEPLQVNEYALPENWKELCIPKTNVSIHDIMEQVN